jgi:hypothetical protein
MKIINGHTQLFILDKDFVILSYGANRYIGS